MEEQEPKLLPILDAKYPKNQNLSFVTFPNAIYIIKPHYHLLKISADVCYLG